MVSFSREERKSTVYLSLKIRLIWTKDYFHLQLSQTYARQSLKSQLKWHIKPFYMYTQLK